MSPEDKIRAGWDDDDQPRSAFPEPLTERLTREVKELRAENERLIGDVAALAYRNRMLDARWQGFRDAKRSAVARIAELEGALQTSRDNHQGAEEKLNALVADLRVLVDEWFNDFRPLHLFGVDLRTVLDKHAGEIDWDPAREAAEKFIFSTDQALTDDDIRRGREVQRL